MRRRLIWILSLSAAAPAYALDDECHKTESGAYVCKTAERLNAPEEAVSADHMDEVIPLPDKAADAPRAAGEARPIPRETAAEAPAPALPPRANRSPSAFASAYAGFGQAVFLRGGYAFSGDMTGPGDETRGLLVSGGYRRALEKKSKNQMSVETEAVFLRDVDRLAASLETTLTGVTGVVSLRWDASPDARFNPFASLGGGVAHYKLKTDDGTSVVTVSQTGFGYTARAGVEAALAEQVSLEAAYRFLGAVNNIAEGVHAAEVGLNYEF